MTTLLLDILSDGYVGYVVFLVAHVKNRGSREPILIRCNKQNGAAHNGNDMLVEINRVVVHMNTNVKMQLYANSLGLRGEGAVRDAWRVVSTLRVHDRGQVGFF